jgi:hypothetical protein
MENLITEGRYDQVTTELSREIIGAVKRGIKRYQTQITLFSRTKVDVSFYLHYSDDNLEPQVYAGTYINPKGIRKIYKNKRIVFHVEIPNDMELRNRSLSVLVPELKNTIRHEIEHVAQHKFTDRERKNFFSTRRGYPEDINYFEYLMEPYEVEAYVRGLYRKAKTLKQPLKVILDDWWNYLDERVNSGHLTADEAEQIKNAWIAYAKKHLPKTFDRKLGYSDEERITEVGFKPSYMKPEIHAVINFDAPNANKDLKPILVELLERRGVKINEISGGNGGIHNPYKLDVSVYNEREIGHLINDLHIHLMTSHDVRIKDVTHFIK